MRPRADRVSGAKQNRQTTGTSSQREAKGSSGDTVTESLYGWTQQDTSSRRLPTNYSTNNVLSANLIQRRLRLALSPCSPVGSFSNDRKGFVLFLSPFRGSFFH